jgi:hypothetical protein
VIGTEDNLTADCTRLAGRRAVLPAVVRFVSAEFCSDPGSSGLLSPGMILGMTVRRTFSLPDEVSEGLDRVAGGNASAFVAETIQRRLDREDFLARLGELPGWPSEAEHPEEFARARAALGLPVGPERQAS